MTTFASYGAAVLPGVGKKGILKKLDNGYYEIMLGGLGTFGNGGWIYDERTAIQYMENNPEFLALLANKRLRSEWGHPIREPGMTDAQWFERIHTIYEPNWSSHIRKVHLSTGTVKDSTGRAIVAIIGEVRGTGPKALNFDQIMENPDEDLNYSIRSFARRDFQTHRKHISKIITWDSVWNPGIAVANKLATPSCESATDVAEMLNSVETEFNLNVLRNQFEQRIASGESFESSSEMVKVINMLTRETKTTVSMGMPKRFEW